MKEYRFTLSRDGNPLGEIRWTPGTEVQYGDTAAIEAFNAALTAAIAARHNGYPMPQTVYVDSPVLHILSLILVLQFGGFDIPGAFADDTPEARLQKQRASQASWKETLKRAPPELRGVIICY